MAPSSPPPLRNILIVEDEPDVRDALACLLELEGFAVHTAGNGAEALVALADHGDPCLILLDVMMPVMDGVDFLRILRADAGRPRIPVVVTSASCVEPEGADALLPKPVDLNRLLDVLRVHCA